VREQVEEQHSVFADFVIDLLALEAPNRLRAINSLQHSLFQAAFKD